MKRVVKDGSGVGVSDGGVSRTFDIDMATESEKKIWRACAATLAAVLMVAALFLTSSVSGASSGSAPFCKDVNKFGALLNSNPSSARAAIEKAIHLSQKITNEAPHSAEPAWSVLTADFSKILQRGGNTKKNEHALATATGNAHRAATKVCG